MSAHFQDHGFILRRIRYSESSLILWWLTREHGILKTMAKGALRPKQPFFGKTDLFYECDLTFLKSSKSQVSTLIEVGVIDLHSGFRNDYGKVLALNYFGELVTALAEGEAPIPELHRFFAKAIQHLKDHQLSWKLIDRFERVTFQALGLDDGQTALDELRDKWLSTRSKSYGLLQRELARNKA